MKVRCAYCQAAFEMEAGRKVPCPGCGRLAILPRSPHMKEQAHGGEVCSDAEPSIPARMKRRVNSPLRDQEGEQPSFAKAAGIGLLQRPAFVIGLGVAILLGLIALLQAPAIQAPAPYISKAPENVAAREMAVLVTALGNFTLDCKRLPTEAEGLPALLNNPGLFGWRGPYLTLLRPDPWGHAYVYRPAADTNACEVFSAGPDGVEGTPDDLRPRASKDKESGHGVEGP